MSPNRSVTEQLTSGIRTAVEAVAQRWGRHDVVKRTVLGAIALTVALLTLIPLCFFLWTSVWTGYPGQFSAAFTVENFVSVYLEGGYEIPRLLSHSVFVAVGMTLIAVSFGLLLAWLLVRTNLPTKGAMELVIISPYAVPGYIYAIVYVATYGPDTGIVTTYVTELLGLQSSPFPLFSPWGITVVAGINGVTTIYLLTVPALQTMDPALEEAARIHGANIVSTVRSVTFPLILPAIVSGALVTFLRGMGEFSVVDILGSRNNFEVYATAIWEAIRQVSPPQYGEAAALAMSLLVITVVLVWYYRRITSRKADFMTLTGRGGQPRRWDLGRFRWPIAIAVWIVIGVVWLLPILVMVVVSLHSTWAGHLDLSKLTLTHYVSAITDQRLRRAFTNSVFVSVTGATIGTVLVIGLAYYTERTAYRFRRLVDVLSLSPLAIPGIILGSSVLFTFLWIGTLVPFLNLYGTLWIIVVGSVVVYLPFASRIAIGNIVQIHADLEESARIFGASWLQQLREIFLPLSKKTTAIIWFYLAIHIFQLLTIAIMTYTSRTEVAPIAVFNMFHQQANIEFVSAVSTLFIGMMLALLAVFRFFGVTFYELDGP